MTLVSFACRSLGALILVLFIGCALAQAPAPKPYAPRFGQSGKDVVWVPMPDAAIERLLDIAKVTPDDYLIDLGSGDGRVVIAAARRGARALGVEFNPDLVSYSKREAEKAAVAQRAQFVHGDLFKADLSQATVITLFLLQDMNIKLRPSLLALKPGTRVAANTFHMGDWQPDVSEWQGNGCEAWCALYLWIVPARVAGAWRAPQGELKLKQQYQTVTGSLGDSILATAILDGKLEGDRIRFSSGGARYSGRVTGSAIEGTVETGNGLRPWKAAR